MSLEIKEIKAIEVLDSRGNPTVSTEVELTDGSKGSASVPSGASTGEYEAYELRDGDHRFFGKGVQKAVSNINGIINKKISGYSYQSQKDIDSKLIELDGTENKSNLGANALLGVSLSYAKAVSNAKKIALYEYLAQNTKSPDSSDVILPLPMANVLNGGAHANNGIGIQEFMLVPNGAPTFKDALRSVAETFQCLGKLVDSRGLSTGVGDEGGYAPNLSSSEEAFELLLESIDKAGYQPGKDISLALDVASSELLSNKENFTYSMPDKGELSSEDLINIYDKWIEDYPILSIEDGLDENDWDGWKSLSEKLAKKVQLVGDDLFVTNSSRLKRGVDEGVANSILIKLNQIGTLSETIDAIELAHANNYTSVVSHRSGETADTSISDLAVACRTGQIKTGSTCRGERTEKYNRLLWIEYRNGAKAKLAKPFG